tara:strand:+ start:6217 stop:6831 length:615 start_codon:yes stop_codon:yes gene_type:complete
VLSIVEEPFVPDGIDPVEVDERWLRLRRTNPALFDGRVLHVLGVHRNGHGGVTIHLVECSYRYVAVQDGEFDCGVRTLGVKGLVRCDGRLLVGRRADWVHHYPGQWEFAPAGGVEPGRAPAQVLLDELSEETGCIPAGPPIARALLLDDEAFSWELVYELTADGAAVAPGTDEYSELRWCGPDALPQPLSPVAARMRGLLQDPT